MHVQNHWRFMQSCAEKELNGYMNRMKTFESIKKLREREEFLREMKGNEDFWKC